jgi:predicted lipid-binding transport protein (Tim44 family)
VVTRRLPRPRRPRLRLGPRARRTARRLAALAAGLAVVVLARIVLGVWAAAGLVALAVTAGLIAGWAAVEARAFRPSPPSTPAGARGPGLSPGDHVAFARALTAVATAYLTACERQEHQR